jgi:hypothetical protein
MFSWVVFERFLEGRKRRGRLVASLFLVWEFYRKLDIHWRNF